MKKNKKGSFSPEDKAPITKKPVPSAKKIVHAGANASFPQEYEEQRSMDIRMKPQPLVKAKKSGGLKDG